MRIRYLFLAMFLCTASWADITLSLDPFPLAGNNGVSGWGFTLNNDTSSYLSVDSVQLAGTVDNPLFRFGSSSNFIELFATYQFNAPAILIAPNSIYTLAYNGADQGLAAWIFPDGAGSYGALASNRFQIQVGYALYDDDAYGNATLSGGVPVTGALLADAQLQYAPVAAPVPEPASWLLLAVALALTGLRTLAARAR